MVVSLAGVVAVVVSELLLVVDEVEESLLLPLPPHAAVSEVNAMTAAIPAVTEKRRGIRVWVMSVSASVCRAIPLSDLPTQYPCQA
jgi:hypothetical protein